MMWIRFIGFSFLAMSQLAVISSCDGNGGVDANVAPSIELPTATVVPAKDATINGSTWIVVSFSDAMDPATLALAGTMAGQSDGGTWSTTTNVNDTLTVAPVGSWSNGAQTLVLDASNVVTAKLPTVTLNYTVDATLPVASIMPTNGNSILGNVVIVITFNESINTASITPSGSIWNQGDGGVWSSTVSPDDTLTISPKNLWNEGAVNLTLGVIDLAGNAVTLNLSYTVAAATCSDSIQNQDETDVDCGGSSCSSCPDGNSCIVDLDCSSAICTGFVCAACSDVDGDGACDSLDCAPGDPSVYPGAVEVCNGIDEDCNGFTDDVVNPAPCALQEGVCSGSTAACDAFGGWAACDASNYGPSYESIEATCDGLDNDCDGIVDEGCPP